MQKNLIHRLSFFEKPFVNSFISEKYAKIIYPISVQFETADTIKMTNGKDISQVIDTAGNDTLHNYLQTKKINLQTDKIIFLDANTFKIVDKC